MKRVMFVLFAFVVLTIFGLNTQVSYADTTQVMFDSDDVPNDTKDTIDTKDVNVGNGDFIFADSSTRDLSYSELKNLSSEELRIARNEIYARNGRIFKSKDLANYFNKTSWYVGKIAADKFDEKTLNKYETANIALIKEVERLLKKEKETKK